MFFQKASSIFKSGSHELPVRRNKSNMYKYMFHAETKPRKLFLRLFGRLAFYFTLNLINIIFLQLIYTHKKLTAQLKMCNVHDNRTLRSNNFQDWLQRLHRIPSIICRCYRVQHRLNSIAQATKTHRH